MSLDSNCSKYSRSGVLSHARPSTNRKGIYYFDCNRTTIILRSDCNRSRYVVSSEKIWRMQESKCIPECFNGCLFTII